MRLNWLTNILSLLLLRQFYCIKVNDRNYPRFHMAPPFGWMNDPNGFCKFKDEYHIFYQYNPYSSLEAGIAHWGHAKSVDLIHWKHLPIAIYPNNWYDRVGAFSGSALVENDTMYIMYTGNVNGSDWKVERQVLASSKDGVNVEKYEYNPIIEGEEYQPDFRDPKIWKHESIYYAVLGNSFDNSTRGRILLFSSKDLTSWQMMSVLGESDGSLGYMWECPNFFELDDKFVLLFSPQGVQPEGDKFRNLYQTGYMIGNFNYSSYEFDSDNYFKEIDHGHDFYAPQILVDNGQVILIAWFDMWEQNYREGTDGWTGLLTLPRILSLSSDRQTILQKPIKAIKSARCRLLYSGQSKENKVIPLQNKAGDILIRAPSHKNIELFIESKNSSTTVSITYSVNESKVILDRGGDDGIRRTNWKPNGALKWRIFVDASSIELFCGEGEVTFSSRFFPDGPVRIRMGEKSEAYSLQVFSLCRTIPKP